MQVTQILIPIDAEIFWQQVREIVGDVIDQRSGANASNKADTEQPLLKLKGLSRLFQISKSTIYEWIKKDS